MTVPRSAVLDAMAVVAEASEMMDMDDEWPPKAYSARMAAGRTLVREYAAERQPLSVEEMRADYYSLIEEATRTLSRNGWREAKAWLAHAWHGIGEWSS